MKGTLRQRIADRLRAAEADGREISQALGVAEKEVYPHLRHVFQTAKSQGLEVRVTPASCRLCGLVFRDRQRLTTPGRCPRCKHERIRAPRYQIVASSDSRQ